VATHYSACAWSVTFGHISFFSITLVSAAVDFLCQRVNTGALFVDYFVTEPMTGMLNDITVMTMYKQ
jgi:hypothetical protein